jgi:hypothetical protein
MRQNPAALTAKTAVGQAHPGRLPRQHHRSPFAARLIAQAIGDRDRCRSPAGLEAERPAAASRPPSSPRRCASI